MSDSERIEDILRDLLRDREIQSDRWQWMIATVFISPSLLLSTLKLYGLIHTSWWLIWLPLEIAGGLYAALMIVVLIILGTSNPWKDNG